MIKWGGWIIASSWWGVLCATNAEMTAEMDASIPWDFDGPRPDLRFGHCHYSTADSRLTWFLLHDNQMINEGHHLVENVISNVKKWRFQKAVMRLPGAHMTTTVMHLSTL